MVVPTGGGSQAGKVFGNPYSLLIAGANLVVPTGGGSQAGKVFGNPYSALIAGAIRSCLM
jgi:hypothetical protein